MNTRITLDMGKGQGSKTIYRSLPTVLMSELVSRIFRMQHPGTLTFRREAGNPEFTNPLLDGRQLSIRLSSNTLERLVTPGTEGVAETAGEIVRRVSEYLQVPQPVSQCPPVPGCAADVVPN